MGEIVNETVKLILSLSVSGGLSALVLFALKPSMCNKLSKSFQYYIWLVVLLRFVLPFSFGINLMDLKINMPDAPQVTEETATPGNQNADPTIITPTVNDNTANINNTDRAEQQPPTLVSTDSTKPFDLMKTLMGNLQWIWITGVILSAAFQVLGFLRFIRNIHSVAYAVEMPDRGVKVYRSRLAPTPMLVGVIKPRIYLPEIAFTDEQLNNILLHERTHLRRGDVWLKWFATFVVSLHWFNPIVYFMRRELNRACELSCDEAVIRNLDGSARQSYGDTLISVVAKSRYPIGVMSTNMCEEKKKLEERLVAIMNYRKKTKIVVVITTVLAVAITMGVFSFGAGRIKKTPHSPSEIKLSNAEEQKNNTETDLHQRTTKGDELTFEDADAYKGKEAGSGDDSIRFLQEWNLQTKLQGNTITLTCAKDGDIYEARGAAQGMMNRLYLDGYSIFMGILGDSAEAGDTSQIEYARVRLDFTNYNSVETIVKNRNEIFVLIVEGLPQLDDIGVFDVNGNRVLNTNLNGVFDDHDKQDALTYGVLWVPILKDAAAIPTLHIERVGLPTVTYIEQAGVMDVDTADMEVSPIALAARPEPMMAVIPDAPLELQFSVQPKRVTLYGMQYPSWPEERFDVEPSEIELNEMSFRVPDKICWMGYIVEAEFENMTVRYKMMVSVFSN